MTFSEMQLTYMTTGMSFHLSEPQFPHLKKGIVKIKKPAHKISAGIQGDTRYKRLNTAPTSRRRCFYKYLHFSERGPLSLTFSKQKPLLLWSSRWLGTLSLRTRAQACSVETRYSWVRPPESPHLLLKAA